MDSIHSVTSVLRCWPLKYESNELNRTPVSFHITTEMTIVCNGGCVSYSEESSPSPGSPLSLKVQSSSKEINFSGHELKSLPDVIRQNTCLSALDLSANRLGLNDATWDLGSFTCLESLNLSANELRAIPASLTTLTSLQVLSLTGNELENISEKITDIHRLKRLHVDFNHLCSLPTNICNLSQLRHLTLSGNKLKDIPTSLWTLQSLEVLHIQRNHIASLGPLPEGASPRLKELKLNRNRLAGVLDLNSLQNLEILNVSRNHLELLEIAELTKLQLLKCSSNDLQDLQVHGEKLRLLKAKNNFLETIECTVAPTSLEVLNISHNHICKLPSCLDKATKLKVLCVAHNVLTSLENGLPAPVLNSIEVLQLNHNLLARFPDLEACCSAKTLCLQYNNLGKLPENFFLIFHCIEEINLSHNQLESLPSTPISKNLKMALLSGNQLNKACFFDTLLRCEYLEVLHVASNGIQELPEDFFDNLPRLKELSLAGNSLRNLPSAITTVKQLQKLYLHSNKLSWTPPMIDAMNLKVLDLACNLLHDLELVTLVPKNLTYLDLSSNGELRIDPKEFHNLCSQRSVAVVDINCAGQAVVCTESSRKEKFDPGPWLLGFTESQEGKTRLYIELQNTLSGNKEALIALLEVDDVQQATKLRAALPELLKVEKECEETSPHYLRNTLLSAARFLRSNGHTRDSGITICHLSSFPGSPVTLRLGTVGRPSSCILGRAGNVIILAQREDTITLTAEKWNKALKASEVLSRNQFDSEPKTFSPKGAWASIPDPEIRELVLSPQDKFIVFGDSAFANTVATEDVLKHVQEALSPAAASKSLSEMYSALSEGKRESVAVVMLRGFHVTGGDEDVEKYRCWEFMLEQNHKLLFTKELETIHKSILRGNDNPSRTRDTSTWYNVALSKYKCPLPSHRGRYYCYGSKTE